MIIQNQAASPKLQYSTDFVLISADWSLERIRKELNASSKAVAIVERYSSSRTPSPSFFIYPRWLLILLLEGIKKVPIDESALNDIKLLFKAIGKPLNLTVSKLAESSSPLDFHSLLSLQGQTGDLLVQQRQKNPDRPTAVVYSGGPRAYHVPEYWHQLEPVYQQQVLSNIPPSKSFSDSELDFDSSLVE